MGPVWPGVLTVAVPVAVVVGLVGVFATGACLPGFTGLIVAAGAWVATGAAGSVTVTGAAGLCAPAAGVPVSMAVVPAATGCVWLMPFAARTSSSVY